MYTSGIIASIVNGHLSGVDVNPITYLSVDSRKISFPSETLFFALVTSRRNGHQFIGDVYNQGVRSFVVNNLDSIGDFPGACFILVPDTLFALQQLASHHRSEFTIPVIGITGSNGKTIVKEWLNQLLQFKNKVVRSPKSFNSQVGVPLSVWQMTESHTVGIFEAGISKPGEMAALQSIIQPTIGILTNIGAAHDEGFINRRQKLEEKIQLFSTVNTLVCCFDDLLIKELVTLLQLHAFSWGKDAGCTMQVTGITSTTTQSAISIIYNGKAEEFSIRFTDSASIENALHCIALMLHAGIQVADIAERILQLHPVEMRLEWKKAINNCYLLNDSYSNDLSSFIIALNYLEQQHEGSSRTVILSDFFESGLSDEMLYTRVATILNQHQINRLFAVGEHITRYQLLFEATGLLVSSFDSTEALIDSFDATQFVSDNILLKGARRFGFERIVQLLEQQVHQTVLEINLTALTHNLHQYRQLLRPGVKLMVMVKAFGYGSGDAEVAKVLQYNKVDYIGVAYADEGVALRKAGIHLPVMVMNPEPGTFETIEQYNLEPEIYSFSILEAFEQYCETQGISQYPIHIKLDTGMHRLGFEMHEVSKLTERLQHQNILVVKTAYTHLAASEDPKHDDFTQHQSDQFAAACEVLESKLGYPVIKHVANTSAIRRHPNKHFDMVRLGIGMYGLDVNMEDLQVVNTLKTTVAQVKKVAAGETVGYGRKGVILKDSVIATVRIGYADGYRRQLSNGLGFMHVKNQKAPVIGNVCMDMTMIDITHIPGVKAGDDIEIFGIHIPIQQIARQCNTISYEILTGISQRVKRVYLQE
ncbi:MAG: bifunctional UDP-N-acetylmuramoyl-tripeptide:D-alanyl-D-alanine ligase/alanine racemase [Bacteroidota bacterium]